MKIEKREMTVIRLVYITEDGAEFDNEWDCKAHEAELMEQSIDFYDWYFTPTDIDHSIYAIVNTEVKVAAFKTLCDYTGYTTKGLDKPGIYFFTDGEWVNISNAVKVLEERINGN